MWIEIFCTKLQLPPESLTKGLPPTDPRSLCPQLNLLNPTPEQNSWVRHCLPSVFWFSMFSLSKTFALEESNTICTKIQFIPYRFSCWPVRFVGVRMSRALTGKLAKVTVFQTGNFSRVHICHLVRLGKPVRPFANYLRCYKHLSLC